MVYEHELLTLFTTVNNQSKAEIWTHIREEAYKESILIKSSVMIGTHQQAVAWFMCLILFDL